MSKFLLLIFALAVAFWWIGRLRGRDTRGDAGSSPPDPAAEQMVACSHCGLNLPLHEAIAEGERFFCCAEHRRRAG